MTPFEFASIISRDLDKLKVEIESYHKEQSLWVINPNIPNTGGNLCLHLIGNLNTYIGKDLGGIAYNRNRPAEFSDRNVPRALLIEKIDDTKKRVVHTLENLEESSLNEDFPYIVLDQKYSIAYMLIHLTAHLSYHLGQINYHRRLLGNQ